MLRSFQEEWERMQNEGDLEEMESAFQKSPEKSKHFQRSIEDRIIDKISEEEYFNENYYEINEMDMERSKDDDLALKYDLLSAIDFIKKYFQNLGPKTYEKTKFLLEKLSEFDNSKISYANHPRRMLNIINFEEETVFYNNFRRWLDKNSLDFK